MQMIVDIIQAHGSFNNIFAVRYFLDKFVFVFVVLIVDLTDNFLKNVFQSDKAGHLTVLIENNSDIEGGFSHFYQKIGDILVLISEMRLAKKIADIKGIILIVKKKILHIDDSDDIVLCVFVDRKTGKSVSAENIDQFLIAVIYIGKRYIYTGNHNILGICITEIENIVDHFLLVGFDDTILMAYINDGTQFFFRHDIVDIVRIYTKNIQEKSRDQVDHKDYRCHDSHQKMNYCNVAKSNLLGIDRSIVLRGDLSKYQNRNSQCQCCNADHITAQMICECSCKR